MGIKKPLRAALFHVRNAISFNFGFIDSAANAQANILHAVMHNFRCWCFHWNIDPRIGANLTYHLVNEHFVFHAISQLLDKCVITKIKLGAHAFLRVKKWPHNGGLNDDKRGYVFLLIHHQAHTDMSFVMVSQQVVLVVASSGLLEANILSQATSIFLLVFVNTFHRHRFQP